MKQLSLIDTVGRWVRFSSFADLEINQSLVVLADPPEVRTNGEKAFWNGRTQSWEYRVPSGLNPGTQAIPTLFELSNPLLAVNHKPTGPLRKEAFFVNSTKALKIPVWARNGLSKVFVTAIAGGAGGFPTASPAGWYSGTYVERFPISIPKNTTEVLVEIGLGGAWSLGNAANMGGNTIVTLNTNRLVLPGSSGSTIAQQASFNDISIARSQVDARLNTAYWAVYFVGSGIDYLKASRITDLNDNYPYGSSASGGGTMLSGWKNEGRGFDGFAYLEFEEIR